MRKKVLFFIIVLLPILSIMFSMQSCLKNKLFFKYSYVIVQTLSYDEPTKDTVIPVNHAGLRVYIVPERYYDRFASVSNPFISSAYAEGIFDDDTQSEENDSIISLDVWTTLRAPGETHDSTSIANADIRYKVDGEKKWVYSPEEAVRQFNERAEASKGPQYIEVDFDKFFKKKGHGFFSVHLATKKRGEDHPIWAKSNDFRLY